MLVRVKIIDTTSMEHMTGRARIQTLGLTGGPGGGKSKLAKFIEKKAKKHGIVAMASEEAATVLMNAGLSPKGGESELLNFQRAVMRETASQARACKAKLYESGASRMLFICDRPTPDIRAYVSDPLYRDLLREHGFAHHVYARDLDCDAVIHMRTAALGAEAHYSNKSNKRRSEDLDGARALDQRTLEGWIGHPHLAVIGNRYASFRGKLEAAWRAARRLLGVPAPLEIEKKYLVQPADFAALGVPHRTIDIEQHYLVLPEFAGETCRVRSWGEECHATYTFTRKRHVARGVAEEFEEQISELAFAHYTKYRDPRTVPLTKRRTCFVYEDQYFMYDEFLSGRHGLTLLEIEVENLATPVMLPDFLSVRGEVTGDHAYSSAAIARNR